MARLIAFCCAILISVSLVSFGTLALSPSYNECIRGNGQHPVEQYTNDGHAIITAPIESPTTARLLVVCGSYFANKNGEAFTGLFTIALTIGTFLLGFLAWDQGQSSRAQLRAYVFIDSLNIDHITLDGRPRFRLSAKNFGQTPAFGLFWFHTYDFFNFPADDLFDFPEVEMASKTALGPQGVTYKDAMDNEFILTRDRWEKLLNGSGAIYAWGYIEYTDAFKRRHRTTYRYNIGGGEQGRIRLGMFRTCDAGNDAY